MKLGFWLKKKKLKEENKRLKIVKKDSKLSNLI